MQKDAQQQGRVDLTAAKASEQFFNRLLKKCIQAIVPKCWHRKLGTAAFLALVSVKIGGGGL
jgi:hypothetical protein